MKKRWLMTALLVGLLVSCIPQDEYEYDDSADQTFIAFRYSSNYLSCTAIVYDDPRRRDEDKIAELWPTGSSWAIPWTPGALVPFYFSYRIKLNGLSYTVYYHPLNDRILVNIDANTITDIRIPSLSKIVVDKAYIVIHNNSTASPFRLQKGTSDITPDNVTSPLVNVGERAHYLVNPGPATLYQLLVPPDYLPLFPGSLDLRAGYLYNFMFDGDSVSSISEIEIKLENVDTVSIHGDSKEITIAMWDSAGDGWNDGAALKVLRKTSFYDISDNVSLTSGKGPGYYTFYDRPGYRDNAINFYWVGGGQRDNECSFEVYFSDDPPPRGEVLVSKQYSSTSGAVGDGKFMGSFQFSSGR